MKHEVSEVIADVPWGYRRRARLSLNYLPKTQQLQMGFRKAGSSDIVDIKQCPILVPQLEALLPKVRACLGSLQAIRHLGHVELVQATSGTLMILRHTAPLSSADREKLERFSHSEGLDLYLAPDSEILETVSGEMPWYDSNGLRLTFSPRDFIQVNAGVNQKMVARALEWLDVQPENRVLDLFCGMGNFTLPLATQAASVVGVEGVPALVEKGQQMVEKGKKGILQVVFGRTTIILLLLLVQVGILVMATGLLQEYIVYAYWAFILLTDITVIIIINREGNPGFKLAWMVPITLVPVFGLLLYIFVELQPGTRLMNRRLRGRVRQMRQYAVQNPEIIKNLKEQDPQVANLAGYIHSRAGGPAYQNTAAVYFPLGEGQVRCPGRGTEKSGKIYFHGVFHCGRGTDVGYGAGNTQAKSPGGRGDPFMYDGTNTLFRLPYDYPRQLEHMEFSAGIQSHTAGADYIAE